MSNSFKFILFFAAGLIGLLAYESLRSPVLEKLRAEQAAVVNEQQELRIVNQELEDMSGRYSIKADMAEFIEQLYGFARQANISDHQLVTRDGSAAFGQFTAGGRSSGKRSSSGLDINRIEVILSGSYREIAEYLKLVQDTDNPKQITRFTLKPLQDTLQLRMTLDLYSLKETHGT